MKIMASIGEYQKVKAGIRGIKSPTLVWNGWRNAYHELSVESSICRMHYIKVWKCNSTADIMIRIWMHTAKKRQGHQLKATYSLVFVLSQVTQLLRPGPEGYRRKLPCHQEWIVHNQLLDERKLPDSNSFR